MHLLIDGQALQANHVKGRGIGRYSSNLIDGLLALGRNAKIELILHSDLEIPQNIPIGISTLVFPSIHYPKSLLHRNEQEKVEFLYGEWLNKLNPDWILIPNPMDYDLLVPRFFSRRTKVAAIHYDLIPLLFHPVYLKEPFYFTSYASRLRQLLSFDLLLSISKTSTNDLVRLFPETENRTETISGATDPFFAFKNESPGVTSHLKENLQLDKEFLFHLGGPEPRKNLDGAIKALGHLVHDYNRDLLLVLVCNPHSKEKSKLEAIARECAVLDRLRLLPRMNDQELRFLYENCRVFLFPSYYEGLGLPVLEAQQLGAPIALSNVSSLPEFAGVGAALFNPGDPKDIAKSVHELLELPRNHGQKERKAFANEFSWQKTALLAWNAMESFRQSHRVSTNPKAAICISEKLMLEKPLANLIHPLLEAKKEYHLDLVIDTPLGFTYKAFADLFPVINLNEFQIRKRMGRYDAILNWNGDGSFT